MFTKQIVKVSACIFAPDTFGPEEKRLFSHCLILDSTVVCDSISFWPRRHNLFRQQFQKYWNFIHTGMVLWHECKNVNLRHICTFRKVERSRPCLSYATDSCSLLYSPHTSIGRCIIARVNASGMNCSLLI